MSPGGAGRGGAPVGGAYLVTGSDAGLVSQELSRLVGRLAGESLGAVEEYGPATADEAPPLGQVLDACRTPPFLTERRIVVLRGAEGLDSAGSSALAAYLAEPLETTTLVLVAVAERKPAALIRALRDRGEVLDTDPGSGKARAQWLETRLRDAPVRLDSAAAARLGAHLGEDVARLDGVLGALDAAYGDGGRIGVAELEGFLGEPGGVAPWDLTDAIDSGRIADAVSALRRQLRGGGRHPLQVLAGLHRHFGAMLRLDGLSVTAEEAVGLTGLSPFPARKVLEQGRRLGHERVTRAIELLAAADLALRGALAWPEELVLEVLVARLAQLNRPATAARRRGARAH